MDTNQSDIDIVLSHRHDNGDDFWATEDNRIGVGDPFGTMTSLVILHELGLGPEHEAVRGALERVLRNWQEDGRFRVSPGTIYPCHTAVASRAVCRYGCADDERLRKTFRYLLEDRYEDGGWRCRKFSGGRGPETDFSNPGVTLFALDALRFSPYLNRGEDLDSAVETLLDHWTVRKPIGPCHFGSGSLFMQVEYPFLRYNLFYYVYVLSFYDRAKKDPRYLEALGMLESKLDEAERVIVERPNLKLRKLDLCAKGQPSEQATKRYREILDNLS